MFSMVGTVATGFLGMNLIAYADTSIPALTFSSSPR